MNTTFVQKLEYNFVLVPREWMGETIDRAREIELEIEGRDLRAGW